MKRYTSQIIAALAFTALFLGALLLAACDPFASQSPPQPLATANPSGTTHFMNVEAFGDLTVGDDTNISGDLKVGNGTPSTTLNGEDAYIEGTFEVDGAVDLDYTLDVAGNTLVSGNIDIAGNTILEGNVADSGGVLTITDNALIDGQADAVQLTVQGYTTQTNSILVVETSAGTDKMTVSNDGNVDLAGSLAADTITEHTASAGVSFSKPVYTYLADLPKTASYNVTAANRAVLFHNTGATAEITFTLPSAAEGLHYCFYVAAAYTITIDPDAADQVHHLTNSAGDRVQNTGTAGDSLCIQAIDTTYWFPINEEGTWADAN